MAELFLHDPIGEAARLARIVGPAAAVPGRPAALEGHAVRADRWGTRIALVLDPEARAGGRILRLDRAQLARLDFAMAAMGAGRTEVALDCGRVAAYLFGGDAPRDGWTAQAGGEAWGVFFAEVLDEVMGHFGKRSPGEMPRLLHGIAYRAFARTRGGRGGLSPELGTVFDEADVVPVERTFAYASFFGIEDHRLRHRRFDGAMSGTVDRAMFTSGDAVTVLPFDVRRDAVLLIEQFRAGAHARRDPRPWFIETVAGRIDPLEGAEDTARREAREEAGLELGRLERIAAYYPSPGIMAEHITAFVGEADLGAAGGTHGLAEEHEDIRTLVVPLDAALAAVARGEVNNAPLLIALLWLAQHRERLAAAWG